MVASNSCWLPLASPRLPISSQRIAAFAKPIKTLVTLEMQKKREVRALCFLNSKITAIPARVGSSAWRQTATY